MVSLTTKQVSPHHVSHTESKYNSVTHWCNSLFIAVQVGSISSKGHLWPHLTSGFRNHSFIFLVWVTNIRVGLKTKHFPQGYIYAVPKWTATNYEHIVKLSSVYISSPFFHTSREKVEISIIMFFFYLSMIWCQQNVGIILKYLL